MVSRRPWPCGCKWPAATKARKCIFNVFRLLLVNFIMPAIGTRLDGDEFGNVGGPEALDHEKHSAKSRALAAGFYIDLPQSAETCVNPDN